VLSYRFAGLEVSSPLALPGLRATETNGTPSIRVGFEKGKPPQPDAEAYDWGGRYRLRLVRTGPDWGFVSLFAGMVSVAPDGRSIRVIRPDACADRGLKDLLVRRVLPRAATLFGGTAVHAASVAKADRALLVYGPTGSGKSTTTALAAQAGWDVLSDDISIIRNESRPIVEPGTTGICLWSDSRAALSLEPGRCSPMPGYERKVRYDPPTAPITTAMPLAGCIRLQRADDCREPFLVRLGQADAIKSLIRQLVLFNPNAPPEERAAAIAPAVAAASPVPAYTLHYPGGYGSQDALLALLERCVGI